MKKFDIINCVNYIYISSSERNSWSLNSDLSKYLFDGTSPENTNKSGWYKLKSIPKSIQVKKANERINIRYVLKQGYTPTEILPSEISADDYNDNDCYDDIIGLYNYEYDEIEGKYEDIEFEINVIYERKDFEFIPNTFNADVDLLTQIEYPEICYQDRPCKVSSEKMFDIIRQHVKMNINNLTAKITSDYDFHFEVKKIISLADIYTRKVDVNNSMFDKRKKPKWVEHTINTKEETILNIKRSAKDTSYGESCSLAPEIIGENYEDIQKKIEKYLDELMAEINKKYKECPCCKGYGIVEDTE